jgi:hypothetical protein
VALDGWGLCEKIGSIEGAAAELDVELVLADAADNPIETRVNGFALIITPNESRGLGMTEGV